MTSKQKIFLIVVVMLFICIVDNFYIGFRMRNHIDDRHTDDIPNYWTEIKTTTFLSNCMEIVKKLSMLY